MPDHTLLTLEETAKRLLVSVCTIKRYLKSGKLVGLKLPNSHWRVFENSYIEFIEKYTSNKT